MIPAKVYMNIVRQWAQANGKPFFTMAEMMKALARYECEAAIKN